MATIELSTVTDVFIPLSKVDAKGDLLVGTAADTVGRQAVGTNGHYLKANSTQTNGIQWAGLDVALTYPVGDETTALTTGMGKLTVRLPFAMTVTAVRASVTTAPTDAALTVDINEGGTSILSTEITIDSGEKTSTTAAVPAVISDSALADDAEIRIDIDQVGSTIAGAGLKVTLIGTRT